MTGDRRNGNQGRLTARAGGCTVPPRKRDARRKQSPISEKGETRRYRRRHDTGRNHREYRAQLDQASGRHHERGARPAGAGGPRQGILQGRGAGHRFRDHARDGAGHDLARRQVRFHLRPSAQLGLQRGRHRPVPHVRMGHHEARRRGQHPATAFAQDRGARRLDVDVRHRGGPRLQVLRARDAQGQGDRGDAEQRLPLHHAQDDGRVPGAGAHQDDPRGLDAEADRGACARARSRRRA